MLHFFVIVMWKLGLKMHISTFLPLRDSITQNNLFWGFQTILWEIRKLLTSFVMKDLDLFIMEMVTSLFRIIILQCSIVNHNSITGNVNWIIDINVYFRFLVKKEFSNLHFVFTYAHGIFRNKYYYNYPLEWKM